MLSPRLRDLLGQTRAGVDILEHSDDVEGDVVDYVAKLRQQAHNRREEGRCIVNEADGIDQDADAIEAALLAAAGALT